MSFHGHIMSVSLPDLNPAGVYPNDIANVIEHPQGSGDKQENGVFLHRLKKKKKKKNPNNGSIVTPCTYSVIFRYDLAEIPHKKKRKGRK